MGDPHVPVQNGASLGADAATTFDFTAVDQMGAVMVANWGPGSMAFNYTDTPPANTTRGADVTVLPPNGVINLPNIKAQFVSCRADGSGAEVDVIVTPAAQGGGF
jgi:hypothetical protein